MTIPVFGSYTSGLIDNEKQIINSFDEFAAKFSAWLELKIR